MYSKGMLRFGRLSVSFLRIFQYGNVFNAIDDVILFVTEWQNEVGYEIVGKCLVYRFEAVGDSVCDTERKVVFGIKIISCIDTRELVGFGISSRLACFRESDDSGVISLNTTRPFSARQRRVDKGSFRTDNDKAHPAHVH